MKKYFWLIVFVLIIPCASFASSKGSYSVISKYDNETSINFKRVPSAPKLWYMTGHVDLSFLSWTNKYTTENASDKFSFKSVLGGDIAVGLKMDKDLRADIEFGWVGNYHEQETEQYDGYITEKTDFDLGAMYLTLNGYYELGSGVYAGLGAGLAIVDVSLNYTYLAEKNKTNISPIGAIMLGWSHKLNDKLDFDIRYRLSAFSGSEIEYGGVKTKIGLITDNALSVGLRYGF